MSVKFPIRCGGIDGGSGGIVRGINKLLQVWEGKV